jgi:hypothetical protein
MAFNFIRANAMRFTTTATPVTTTPLTLSAFGRSSNTTDNQSLLSICEAGTNQKVFFVSMSGGVVGDPSAMLTIGTSTQYATSSSGYSANIWGSVVGLSENASNRTIYLNGGSAVTNTGNAGDPLGLAQVWIGAFNSSIGPGNLFSGDIAECAIWNIALTAEEVASLAKGFKPSRIRPQSLVFYAPLLRNVQELRQGFTLTPVNGPTVADHPRVY